MRARARVLARGGDHGFDQLLGLGCFVAIGFWDAPLVNTFEEMLDGPVEAAFDQFGDPTTRSIQAVDLLPLWGLHPQLTKSVDLDREPVPIQGDALLPRAGLQAGEDNRQASRRKSGNAERMAFYCDMPCQAPTAEENACICSRNGRCE